MIILVSCKEEEKGTLPLDLTPYGIEISILAPDSTTVSIKEYPFMRDINIRKDDHFHIQLFELKSNGNDYASEKERQIALIKKEATFLDIIKEYDKGFIYSQQKDSTTIDYDFRYVRYLGEQQLIFLSGVLTSFSLADIERMVDAIKDEPAD